MNTYLKTIINHKRYLQLIKVILIGEQGENNYVHARKMKWKQQQRKIKAKKNKMNRKNILKNKNKRTKKLLSAVQYSI